MPFREEYPADLLDGGNAGTACDFALMERLGDVLMERFDEYPGNGATPASGPSKSAGAQPHSKSAYLPSNNNYRNNRLSHKDEMALAEYFFKSGFDCDYVNSVKDALMQKRGIVLDTADVFGIALSNIMATHARIFENYHVMNGKLEGKRNEDFDRKIERLYGYIRREKSSEKSKEKTAFDDKSLYMAAMNAIEANGFSTAKQFIVDDIFSNLKEQKIILQTFRETAKSKKKPMSIRDASNPAVFVYNAVIRSGFEKRFTENALGWYNFCLSNNIAAGFYGAKIEDKDAVLPVNLALEAMGNSAGESFEYIKYIGRIKSAKLFMKTAGFGRAAKLIHKADSNRAIEIIKQQVGKYEDGALETALDAIEFMIIEGWEIPAHDVKWILEKYMSPDHPLQMARKTVGRYHPGEMHVKANSYNALNDRIREIYVAFGGNSEIGLSAAEKYLRDKKRRESAPKPAASNPAFDADAYFREQEERLKKQQQEWEERKEMEKNGFKGKEVIFQVSGIKNKNKGVVSGSALNFKLPYNIIAKVPGANEGDRFKARVGKKHGKHYDVMDIQRYEGPLDFKESAVFQEDCFV